jgi:hypothetical protein
MQPPSGIGFVGMFHPPQITFYSKHVNRLRDFYLGLGFEQRFQHPRDGQPIHVELTLVSRACCGSWPASSTLCSRVVKVAALSSTASATRWSAVKWPSPTSW